MRLMTDMPREDRPEQPKSSGFIWELIKTGLLVLVIVLPLRIFVAQPFIVSGASMQPTFDTGDYLIIDQLTYRFEQPQRKDVVVFRYPSDPSKFFIKRIIGLPGETVSINGSSVTITNDSHPNGFTLSEPYVRENNTQHDEVTTTLEEGEYFVLGDNRKSSSDSRVWGELPGRFLVGEAFLQLIPPDEIDLFPGSERGLDPPPE